MDYFKGGSTLIHLEHLLLNSTNKNNAPSQTANQTPDQPKTNHLFLIENIHTRGSKHQSEKEKQAKGTLEVTQNQTFN